jgi:hypothetical protein
MVANDNDVSECPRSTLDHSLPIQFAHLFADYRCLVQTFTLLPTSDPFLFTSLNFYISHFLEFQYFSNPSILEIHMV